MPTVNANFDSGNIEVVASLDQADVQLKIRPDTGSKHFQWFNFEIEVESQKPLVMHLLNAKQASFPGWTQPSSQVSYPAFAYQAMASYNGSNWFRLETAYDGQKLTLSLIPEQASLQVAFFAPYPLSRHHNMVNHLRGYPRLEVSALGFSDGKRPLSLVRIGEPDETKLKCWLIARQHPGESMAEWFMEGLITRLITKGHPQVEELLSKVVFYLVPNMNPDGTILGNLRVNARGVDLNREWQKPSPVNSPEVFWVEAKMREIGVDFFVDVHGDEEIPYVFFETSNGCPAQDQDALRLEKRFVALYQGVNKHVQDLYHYEPAYGPNEADLGMANAHVTQTFGCPSLLMEIPFKDDANHPDKALGWSVPNTVRLGKDFIEPLRIILPQLLELKAKRARKNNEAVAPAKSMSDFGLKLASGGVKLFEGVRTLSIEPSHHTLKSQP